MYEVVKLIIDEVLMGPQMGPLVSLVIGLTLIGAAIGAIGGNDDDD